MTTTFTVWCDGVDTDGCSAWQHAKEGVYTPAEARRDVQKRYGWTRVRSGDGRMVDLCETCGGR